MIANELGAQRMSGLLGDEKVEIVEPVGGFAVGPGKDDDAADGFVVDPHRFDVHGPDGLRRNTKVEFQQFAKRRRVGAGDELMDGWRKPALHMLAPFPVGHERGIG